MFTGRAKPIRIIGVPDNQRPGKWSYTLVPKRQTESSRLCTGTHCKGAILMYASAYLLTSR